MLVLNEQLFVLKGFASLGCEFCGLFLFYVLFHMIYECGAVLALLRAFAQQAVRGVQGNGLQSESCLFSYILLNCFV